VTAALGVELDTPQVGVGFVTGLVDDEVCRCEFQVRRKRPRAFGIGTRSQGRNGGEEGGGRSTSTLRSEELSD
jgi:hypothetical protein